MLDFVKVTDKKHAIQKSEIDSILLKASKDPYLGDFIYKKKLDNIVLFVLDQKVVGFAIPRKDSDGHYRTGPIYVDSAARGKGVAKEFVKQYFENRKGRAWIEKTNTPSQKTFESAGFKRTHRVHVDGDVLYEYLKPE